jgi:hypothetical protein
VSILVPTLIHNYAESDYSHTHYFSLSPANHVISQRVASFLAVVDSYSEEAWNSTGHYDLDDPNSMKE